MMRNGRLFSWSDSVVRGCTIALALLTVGCLLIGFVWLPSVHEDFTVDGLWASLCRAAGVPAQWASPSDDRGQSTSVILTRSMADPGTQAAVGRGATLALNCTMCHGAKGISASDAPNLAGQYSEVIIKQMQDFRQGHRVNPVMQAIAGSLSATDVRDLAAYYAYLPKARVAPTTYDEALPSLVRVGDPLRNIAPCISCHGGVDQKLGAPWLEGMPKRYLVTQLNAFIGGTRHNDAGAQMRNMVRWMTEKEVEEVAEFYARKAGTGEVAQRVDGGGSLSR